MPHTGTIKHFIVLWREPCKGRNVPAGVTNRSTRGTVNPNKQVRVTSLNISDSFLWSTRTKATARERLGEQNQS